jgi:hypothetical protein
MLWWCGVSFDNDNNNNNNNNKHAYAGVTDSFTHLRFLLVLTKCPLNCHVEMNRERRRCFGGVACPLIIMIIIMINMLMPV